MFINSNKPQKTRDFQFTKGFSKRQLIELDACMRCGACLDNCPSQDATLDTSISPPDKISTFRSFIERTEGLSAKLLGPQNVTEEELRKFSRAVYECTTCGYCGEVCEAGIFSMRLWPFLRAKMVEIGYGPWGGQNMMEEVTFKTGNVYNMPTEDRYKWWPAELPRWKDEGEVCYYTGCTTAYESQPMAIGDARMMAASGIEFMMLPEKEDICCGFPLYVSGQHERLPELVRPLIHDLQKRGVKTLVTSCPCCCNTMTRDWPQWYDEKLPFKIRHMSQFILENIKSGKIKFEKPLNERIVYDDPCYLARGVGLTEEPREVLKKIPGVDLAEFPGTRFEARCCGAGGAVKKVFSENAKKLARIALDEAKELGVSKMVMSCPACFAKVNESNEGYHDDIKVIDIMELCSEHLKADSPIIRK